MKNRTKYLASLLLSATMLIPATFSAQGKGKGNDNHGKDKGHDDHKGNDGKFKSKGNDININIKLGDKGKGNDGFNINSKHDNDKKNHYDHPGKGHAYGKYKWGPSKDVVHARSRYRDQLGITINLFRVIDVFILSGHDRYKISNDRYNLAVKNGKIDINVKERRAARLAIIDIRIKELDDLNRKSKLKYKIG